MIQGGVMVYPTDTVWGLGCSAQIDAAALRIAEIKGGRQSGQGFVSLYSTNKMAREFGLFPPQDVLDQYASKPTTWVVESKQNLAPRVLALDGTIALRKAHPGWIFNLIELMGCPLVSTSANFSGQPPPTMRSEVDDKLLKLVDHCAMPQEELGTGVPSRIVRWLNNTIEVLRES